jgi:hypothetical protein
MVADKQTSGVGKTHGNLAGRRERLNAPQAESGVFDPVAFRKASRHVVFLVGLGGCFLHYLFPGLPGFFGPGFLGRLIRFLGRGLGYGFCGSIIMFTTAGIAMDAARLCSLHRDNGVSQNQFAFRAIRFNISTYGNFAHEQILP